MITIIVCQCCEDLVQYSNCTYQEAMDIIIDDEGFIEDRKFHGNEYTIKDSLSKDCSGCEPDERPWP